MRSLSPDIYGDGIYDHVPSAFGKEIIFAVDMDHTVFQYALPLVFHSCDLQIPKLALDSKKGCDPSADFVISAKNDIRFQRA